MCYKREHLARVDNLVDAVGVTRPQAARDDLIVDVAEAEAFSDELRDGFARRAAGPRDA